MKKLERLLFLTTVVVRFGYLTVRKQKTKANKELVKGFMHLGGIYVKFLQLLILRDDMHVPEHETLRESLAVFDQVAPEPIDVQQVLQQAIGSHSAALQVASQPFANGSFGQVYDGKLTDGTQVIVKILRPSVQRNLRFDLRLVSAAIWCIDLFKTGSFVQGSGLFKELRDITLNETDYRAEVEVAAAMYSKYKNHSVITIPKTYRELSSSRVIVQEKVSGVPLTQIMESGDQAKQAASHLGTNLDFVMEELAFESLNANFDGSVAHGDPHPGNIFILPNNRVALIDFGINGEEISRKRELLELMREYVKVYSDDFNARRFTKYMIGFYVPDLVRSLHTVAYATGIDVKTKVDESIGDIVEDILRQDTVEDEVNNLLSEYRMSSIFTKVINSHNRFAVRADLESVALMRSTHIYLSLIKRLGLGVSAAKRAYERVLENQAQYLHEPYIRVNAESLDESLHYISNWLDRMRYSDPVSYVKLQEVIQ